MFHIMKNKIIILQMFQYLLVGIIATAIEWMLFFILNDKLGWHYAFSTSLAFMISTFANWGCGRIILFRKGSQKGLIFEITSIYIVAISGLLSNLLIMAICIDVLCLPDMLSKIIATGVVFWGNFFIRKFWIYRD